MFSYCKLVNGKFEFTDGTVWERGVYGPTY